MTEKAKLVALYLHRVKLTALTRFVVELISQKLEKDGVLTPNDKRYINEVYPLYFDTESKPNASN